MTDTEKMSDRIAALIAKAEGTSNEHERDAFMAKANDLAIKHAIDLATLAGQNNGDDFERTTIVMFATPHKARIAMLAWLGEPVGLFVSYNPYGYARKVFGEMVKGYDIHVHGRVSTLDTIRPLWASLCNQMEAAYLTYRNTPAEVVGYYSDGEPIISKPRLDSKAKFCNGFAMGAAERFRETHQTVVDETPGTGLVLKSDYDRAREMAGATGRGSSMSTSAAGHAAGMSADVGQGRVGPSGPAALGK